MNEARNRPAFGSVQMGPTARYLGRRTRITGTQSWREASSVHTRRARRLKHVLALLSTNSSDDTEIARDSCAAPNATENHRRSGSPRDTSTVYRSAAQRAGPVPFASTPECVPLSSTRWSRDSPRSRLVGGGVCRVRGAHRRVDRNEPLRSATGDAGGDSASGALRLRPAMSVHGWAPTERQFYDVAAFFAPALLTGNSKPQKACQSIAVVRRVVRRNMRIPPFPGSVCTRRLRLRFWGSLHDMLTQPEMLDAAAQAGSGRLATTSCCRTCLRALRSSSTSCRTHQPRASVHGTCHPSSATARHRAAHPAACAALALRSALEARLADPQ